MSYLFKKSLSIFLYFLCVLISAQELPPIQNFSSSDYRAENQNWKISQSSNKLIYIANNKGLLEFNGANWSLYPSPNETIMRSVKVVDDKVYTGCYMEFGYWEKNSFGLLRYTSLSKKIKPKLLEDEEFWNIITVDNWILFQSLKRIYIYNVSNDTFRIIESETKIPSIFKVNESIYFQKMGSGIFKIESGKEVLVFKNKLVEENEIISIFSSTEGLVLLTRNKGFYRFYNNSLVKWNINADAYLVKNSIYCAIQLRNKNFVIGTISNGLLYLDQKGNLLYQISQRNGLGNNTVLSVFEDKKETLWLGLDNGISFINVNSPFKVFKDDRGVLGSVYSSAIYNDNLYLGTNQGLFYKPLKSNTEFELIEDSEGQVWNLKVIDKELFCAHHKGTFIVDNNKFKEISNIPGTWDIKYLDQKKNKLLQGNYDGLYVLEKNGGEWKLKNKIGGFDNSSRYFEILDDKVFVNHEYKGVFIGTLSSDYLEVKNVFIDTVLKGANSSIVKYNKEILYAYKKGVLKYNNDKNNFEIDSILSSIYDEGDYISGKLVYDEKDKKLWAFTNSNLTYISPGELTDIPKLDQLPLTKNERDDVDEYENIINLNNNYLLGSNSGYMLIKKDVTNIENFRIEINTITNRSSNNNQIENLVDKNIVGDFMNKENNFAISFYTPQYNKYYKTHYQYQLEGDYNNWSNWSKNANVSFKNLGFGDYTFKVRSKIGNKISENVAQYTFSIAKPWYISNLMLLVYGLSIIVFSILMHTIYKRYYKEEQRKIEDKNKRTLELTRVQSEKEIMKIRNEQLQKDIQHKSRELAASTMSVVKKNELLTKIKEQLLKSKDIKTIEPVLKIIDRSLDHNDNWKLFKEAFNNVDRKFLKKLKKEHPNLSPNDIKLCAYLRLNLSSKEIAPLFNISSRSVEIKRYRLRKKMNLKQEDNLVKYILGL